MVGERRVFDVFLLVQLLVVRGEYGFVIGRGIRHCRRQVDIVVIILFIVSSIFFVKFTKAFVRNVIHFEDVQLSAWSDFVRKSPFNLTLVVFEGQQSGGQSCRAWLGAGGRTGVIFEGYRVVLNSCVIFQDRITNRGK